MNVITALGQEIRQYKDRSEDKCQATKSKGDRMGTGGGRMGYRTKDKSSR